MKTNLKDIQKVATKFDNNIEQIAKEIKRVQSIKCRLKKMKFKSSYEKEMTEILKYEQILKEAKNLLNPREKYVTEFEQKDVDILTLEETIRAIRSIQSKKTLSRYLVEDIEKNVEYQKACKIEKMLTEHKEKIQEANKNVDKVEKTKIRDLIEVLEDNEEIDKDQLLELLKKLT